MPHNPDFNGTKCLANFANLGKLHRRRKVKNIGGGAKV